MNFARAAALGLGAMKVTDLLKEIAVERSTVLPDWLKSGVASVLAGTGAALLDDGDVRGRVLTGTAAAGLAAVFHEAYSYLQTSSDVHRVTVMRNGITRRSSTSGASTPSQPGNRIQPL